MKTIIDNHQIEFQFINLLRASMTTFGPLMLCVHQSRDTGKVEIWKCDGLIVEDVRDAYAFKKMEAFSKYLVFL